MRHLQIGDVTITSIIEREGPWRTPAAMFPAYDPERAVRHLKTLDPEIFDPASGMMVITYQSFVGRWRHHTFLVDTCTGEDKGYPAPVDFPKQRYLGAFRAAGLSFDKIDYVFCTHLHIDHCGWNTVLRNGRWVPTFPNAKYVFHKREYAAWEQATQQGMNPPGDVWRFNCLPIVEAGQALLVDDDYALDDTIWLTPTPGHAPCHCCVNIRSGGQRAVVTGDLFHHALQVREPQWSTIFDWDPQQGIASRRKFFGEVAGSGIFMLPIHFPHPTVGRIEVDGERFRYTFLRWAPSAGRTTQSLWTADTPGGCGRGRLKGPRPPLCREPI